MTNRRTFLAAAGAAVSWMALPLTATASPHPPVAPPIGRRGAGNVEQWLLGKGQSTLSATDLAFVRSQVQGRAIAPGTCDPR